jgi:hypothetical protein
MRELPVQQVLEPALGDDDVADPEVAVADDRPQRLGPVLPQPEQPELDRRVRLPDGVELVLELLQHVPVAEERDGLGIDRVHVRQLVGELQRQRLARGGELRPADDPPADRLAVDTRRRKGLTAAELAQVADRARHVHARGVGGLEHAQLVLERKRVGVDDAPGGPPHEQLERPLRPAHVDCPGLLRGAARQQLRALELDRAAEQAGERVAELLRPGRARGFAAHADWPPSTTSVCPVT